MQTVLEAVAEPRRREILRLVRTREATAGAIAAHFPDVSRPSVSQHLRVLRAAGLLHERRDGTRRLYRARAEGLIEVREFFEQFWDDRLAALKVAAEAEQRRQDDDRDG
ncbi:MAG TPA: metalloregulator ArsR/SmtB family transcription factor [Pseudonocardia sp.]